MFSSRMSLLFCMYSAMLLAGARGDKVKVQITPANVQILHTQAIACGKEIGVDASTLHKLIHWTIENNDVNKRFLLCVAQKAGYIDSDGHLSKDKMLQNTIIEGALEDYQNSVDECSKMNANDPDSMYAVVTCLYNNIQIKPLDR